MPMWEYKFVVFSLGEHADEPFEEAKGQLNIEGANGWEVVTVLPKMGKKESWCVALMKRETFKGAAA